MTDARWEFSHDDVTTWNAFRITGGPFVSGTQRRPVDSRHKWFAMQSFYFVVSLNKLLNKHISCR